jgi:hypothetical protein
MSNISQPVLAFLNAQGRTPSFVEASELGATQLESLPQAIFADPGARAYPLHTKSAAWLSAASYYGASEERLMLVEDRLVKAAAAFGIAAEVAELKELFEAERVNALTKHASAPEDLGDTWALVREDGTKAYMIKSAGTIVLAAEGLGKDFGEGRLTVDEAVQAAKTLCKRAEHLRVPANEIPYRVLSLGRDGTPDYNNAMIIASLRKDAGYTPEAVTLLTSLLKNAGDGTVSQAEVLTAWGDMDKHFGVSYRQERTPHEALLAGPSMDSLVKQANDCLVLGGVVLPAEALRPALDAKLLLRLPSSEAACLTKLAHAVLNEGDGTVVSVLAASIPQASARRMLDFLVTSRVAA